MSDDFHFDEFRLDVANACLWCRDEPIHLTPKAFEVLQYLLNHPGQLVTREQLLAEVWPEVVVGDSAPASAIRELRKALGDDARTPRYIETVHRRGYRFIAQLSDDKVSNIVPAVRELPKPRRRVYRHYWLAAFVVVVIGAAGLFYLRGSGRQVDIASVADFAYPLPDKPSLVVLPFDNLSGDPQQDYFVDGITEAITTALARIPALFVIARHSALSYKGQAVSIKQVAEEQGVRFVLEGSVQKSGERVRITAQLIDALSGRHMWVEEYDRKLGDIFALQDDITWRVATELEVKLTHGEQARIRRGHTDSVEAYERFLRGWEIHQVFEKQELAQAQQLYRQAIPIIEQAIRRSPYYPPWYLMYLGRAHYVLGEYDKAIALYEKLLEQRPTWSRPRAYLACAYAQVGRTQEAKAEIAYIIKEDPEWTVTKIAQNEHYKDPAIIDRYADCLRQLGLSE